MKKSMKIIIGAALCLSLAGVGIANAKVTAQEAEQLNTTLTPFGAEKAGNADGTIPAWDGGYTKVDSSFVNGGRRSDPFASDKVLYSITAANMDKYADKLTESTKTLLKKYPDTYRIDVYQTRRTASAPQWVYDNTYKNATRAYLEGYNLKSAYGGIPFPVPKSGVEVMWNHLLRWRPSAWHFTNDAVLGTATGKLVMLNEVEAKQLMPYYIEDQTLEEYEKNWKGEFWMIRLISNGPPIKAGEGIVGRNTLVGSETTTWVYMTAQRRVRRLPNSCCDTPTSSVSGVTTYDETEVFDGSQSLERYNWKIVGKKEMYIPYNANKSMQPKDVYAILNNRHLNPDYIRWELHRVWVIEGALAEGMRHQCPRSVYYIDEDTWGVVLSDRYDANGDLWRSGWGLYVVMPDVPGTIPLSWGFYDLISGTWAASNLYNRYDEQFKIMPPYKDMEFTAGSLGGEGVR
ncbi:MAG: DUF1329 domain-containing protein [Deltaproteobacteria bacterium]|nr:DUF1329 domain-containing protein [Deltaproteobacteria bacterium]